METNNYKFRGGIWIGFTSATWPWGYLEVSPDTLIVREELSKTELILSKKDVIRIKTIKVFPIIGYGVRIETNVNYKTIVRFWYWSFKFKELTKALQEFGWL